ncbi:response regulator [Chamaesiphon minutus]|uniref:Response regulator with CheY-like receiver domain and winged-helix DNA-binding domain n=1 Tax=Chamaesiphon minutus (strain ATCC 27169 / PCC 6605) TaxID=1173020 RepID=K9UFP0_CHAP6|nr:response regulator [Chamaesiphon minutus]AFY93236.1 response regulator with CheY-like receiver domain and winged-helix DNA-binding domain [Chamaesiphon minutus PCC 6605]
MSTDVKIILLVEDNRGDIRLIQEALKSTAAKCEVVVTRDGMDAMSYLHQEGEYTNVPLPDLVLLDLNLPKKDGREVLAEIKADPKLKHLPVVVLTTSLNEEDIANSYDLHVNCYIAKSRNLPQLLKIVRGIEEFWLETATLPVKI